MPAASTRLTVSGDSAGPGPAAAAGGSPGLRWPDGAGGRRDGAPPTCRGRQTRPLQAQPDRQVRQTGTFPAGEAAIYIND